MRLENEWNDPDQIKRPNIKTIQSLWNKHYISLIIEVLYLIKSLIYMFINKYNCIILHRYV